MTEPRENMLGRPSANFTPRLFGLGAWTDNIHFAYDLVATLKPRLLVELGTDRGESYFAFCQSVEENKTGTRCFAVDTWRGDEHSG
ncbi:MAG: class I SAM-dependent methyltransferase, partial [Chthoniobacterales bacterium]